MEIFNLIVQLIELIKSFLVFWSPVKYTVIQEGWGGVRFTFGKPGPTLGSGLHWATCGQTFETLETRKIKSNVNQCDNFTHDKVPIRVYGNYTYDIVDVAKFLTQSQDSHWLLVEIAEQEIFSWFSKRSFKECHDAVVDESVTAQLKESINKRCAEFGLGIDVLFVRISDWKIVDPAMQRALALETLVEQINEYDSPDPYIVGLVVGGQPVIDLVNGNSDSYEEEDEEES